MTHFRAFFPKKIGGVIAVYIQRCTLVVFNFIQRWIQPSESSCK
ncbi:hypothetical protein V7122_25245 [Bacillus sp. JJ1532]